MPLPTHERPNGSIFDGEQQHPEFDPAHPSGYETASTGFIMVGARAYDPEIGRFLQPDPRPTGPELQWGQLNRWAYCANDPVNASDPSGESMTSYFGWLSVAVGLSLLGAGIAVAMGALATLGTPGVGLLAGLAALSVMGDAISAALYGLSLILFGIGMLLEDAGKYCLRDQAYDIAAMLAIGAGALNLLSGRWLGQTSRALFHFLKNAGALSVGLGRLFG